MNRFTVRVPADELDLPLCVSSGQVFRWRQIEDGRWLGVDGPHWYLVKVTNDRHEVESSAQEDDYRRLFRLDWDLHTIEAEVLERGPELKPYVEALRGLRLMRPSDPYEVLFCFLCTANNNLARITQLVNKLAEYGEPMAEVAGQVVRRWPSVERIATLDEQELRAKAFGYRGRTIPSVARQLLDRGPDWLPSLAKLPYQRAHDELVSLSSVGPKLADCIALFGLHHMHAAPVDTHLWQAAVRIYFPEWQNRALTDARYRMIGDFLRERFGDWTGVAHQYLFYENLLNWRTRRKAGT